MANAKSNSAARKRKLEDIIRNEPMMVIQYPIRLWSARQNNDVAANFFELWLDDKYQEDLVYCQASRKIVTRQKRQNSNLVRHLKMHNQCKAALSSGGDAPREMGFTSKRERESNCSKSKREGASAACASTGEMELETESTSIISETALETESTSTTDSISTSPLLELEPTSSTSKGDRVALHILIRMRSASTYHIRGSAIRCELRCVSYLRMRCPINLFHFRT